MTRAVERSEIELYSFFALAFDSLLRRRFFGLLAVIVEHWLKTPAVA
jgi:hypothetical protein